MSNPLRITIVSAVGAFLFLAADTLAQTRTDLSRFLGQQSCASSGCHGGAIGKDQCLIWKRKDVHSRAHAILANARSRRMADALGLVDASVSTRCTVCHSPMESVSPALLAPGVKPDKGVSCETCHGPAEKWLRFHTRPDITRGQRIAAGLRDVADLYGRANVCIACHLNIDAEVLEAGHPELFFELDGQVENQPPHWTDNGEWLGAKMWFTGQAAALREISWKLDTAGKDETLAPRYEALIWLLRQIPEGAKQIPSTGVNKVDFAAVQSAADRLARIANRTDWTREKTLETLRRLTSTSDEFRDELLSPDQLRRRAELLILAIDRLWQALKANGTPGNELFEKALQISAGEARAQGGFSGPRFAAALLQVEVAMELATK